MYCFESRCTLFYFIFIFEVLVGILLIYLVNTFLVDTYLEKSSHYYFIGKKHFRNK